MKRTMLLAAAAMFALGACGTTTTDRAASGALMGAGAGAVVGSMTGSAGKGALIGAAVGGAAGAISDPCKYNLGDPVWRDKGASREDYYRRCGRYPN